MINFNSTYLYIEQMLYMLLKLQILFYYLFIIFCIGIIIYKNQALHTKTSAKANKILKNSCMKITNYT